MSYLTVGDVAVMLKKSTKWTYRHAPDIPGSFKLFGSWFFDQARLEDGLKKLAEKPRAENVNPSDRHSLL